MVLLKVFRHVKVTEVHCSSTLVSQQMDRVAQLLKNLFFFFLFLWSVEEYGALQKFPHGCEVMLFQVLQLDIQVGRVSRGAGVFYTLCCLLCGDLKMSALSSS